MEIKWTEGVPESEFSEFFVQGMANRMGVSYFKYGPVERAKGKIDEVSCLRQRLEKYEATGNTEWLIDVANFAMIEFMHKGRHSFRATDSHESPGLKWTTGEQVEFAHTDVSPKVSTIVDNGSPKFYKNRRGD